jgi:Fe-S-cluster containining protein
VRVRALSIHADYGCRSSGACCRSGWPIAVEPLAEQRIRKAVGSGRLEPADWAQEAPGLPHGARVLLRVLASGDCAFLMPGEPRLCAVHSALGEDALPSACRQFPRVATLTPLGVSLTLSHYCPTAAATLLRDDMALAVVAEPVAFPASWPFEGLDAR